MKKVVMSSQEYYNRPDFDENFNVKGCSNAMRIIIAVIVIVVVLVLIF